MCQGLPKFQYVEILTHNPFKFSIQLNCASSLAREHKVRKNLRMVGKGALRPRVRDTVHQPKGPEPLLILNDSTLMQGTDMEKILDRLLGDLKSPLSPQTSFHRPEIRPSTTSKAHEKTSNLSNLEKFQSRFLRFQLSRTQERDTWDDVTVIRDII